MWNGAEEFLKKDKYIAPLIVKWGHCTIKPLKKSLYFQDLVDAICSQQLSIKAAKTIFERVKKCVGKITPRNILDKTDQNLRDCGLSWSKVGYIKDLALQITNNKQRASLRGQITKLDKLSDEEVITELVAVKGIGRWTAEMFLMFSLARPDIFPVDDLGIKKTIQRVTKKQMTKEQMMGFSERWKPYRTVASWYLWKSLENN